MRYTGGDGNDLSLVRNGYTIWADGYPTLSGGPLDDDDNDGWVNLAEYALDGDPTNGFVDGNVPIVGRSDGLMEYVYARRTDDAALSYWLETTDSLVFGTWSNRGYAVTGTNSMGELFDIVTNSIPLSDPEKFIRLLIQWR